MSIRLTTLARQDLDDIRRHTEARWGRAQWLAYYRALAEAFARIEGDPMTGRNRDLFRPGMRSVLCGQHIIFFAPIAAAGGAPVILRILHQRRHLPALSFYDMQDPSG